MGKNLNFNSGNRWKDNISNDDYENPKSGRPEEVPVPHLLHHRFDKASSEGTFFMHVFDDEEKYVPVLIRDKTKYVSIRMAEISLLGEFLNLLPPELYTSITISSYTITAAEVKLLNHINKFHCDGLYGAESFTMLDKIISLEDAARFMEFLQYSFRIFQSGGKKMDIGHTKCGFVKICEDGILIPYTNLESGEKKIPMFYFAGRTDVLKGKVQVLGGWPLAYLKICLYLLGVKKEILTKAAMEVIPLNLIEVYLPKKSTFIENCWPHPKAGPLFSKATVNSAIAGNTSPQVESDKWTLQCKWADVTKN